MCPVSPSCDRIHVSGAFFQSPEFQERGYFAYRQYSVAFGRKPSFKEFMPDLRRVSGFLDATQLEAARVALINDFMARPLSSVLITAWRMARLWICWSPLLA